MGSTGSILPAVIQASKTVAFSSVIAEHVGAVLPGQEAAAMHRLVGEHLRLRRVLSREVELGADIAGERLGRLALGGEMASALSHSPIRSPMIVW